MSLDQMIECPNCGKEFALSASLAGPIIEQERKKYEGRITAAELEATAAKNTLAEELSRLEAEKAKIKAEVAAQVAIEVAGKQAEVTTEIRKQLQEEYEVGIEAQDKRNAELVCKLHASQTSEQKALEAKEAAEEQVRIAGLEVARQVSAKLEAVRESAKYSAEEEARLKIAELEKKLTDTSLKLDEAKKKVEQGSQQLQGEVLELDVEDQLTRAFPWDEIVEVKKGQRGGDCVQRIAGGPGLTCGSILFETKRAQNWSNEWTEKAKQDMRDAKADTAVIVSDVLPKGVTNFGPHDCVWVTKPIYAIAVAQLLRNGLVETAAARKAAAGKQGKADLLYDYMTGPEFCARLKGIAEPFAQMQLDLVKEKNWTQVKWARREKQITRVLQAAMGMTGDLQGLGGADMAQLEGLELRALEAMDDDEAAD